MKKNYLVVLGGIWLWVSGSLNATVINIPADYLTIQAGINAAVDGDTVLVQPHTYIENIDFNGKNIVVASLIVTTNDTSYIAQTIINGNQSGSVVTFSGGEDSMAVLAGFVITNGNGNYTDPDGDGFYSNYGGGIYCVNSAPRLEYLLIINNIGDGGGGGGIFCYNASPQIENVIISGNSTDDVGGGIYCKNNANLQIRYSSHLNNHAAVVGGALYGRDTSNISMEYVLVSNNFTEHAGGGLGFKNSCSPSITNVTIVDNFASHHGAGIYSNNSYTTLSNTILSDNSLLLIYFATFDDPSTITISYSDIQGGLDSIITNDNGSVNWLAGNLDADPLFCDSDSSDYSLAANSPCLGAGTDGGNMGSFDIGCDSILATVMDNLPPVKFILHQNFPNPFNPSTTICYDLPQESQVNLVIYDLLGRKIRTLETGIKPSGFHSITWDATDETGRPVSAGL